MFWPFLRRRKRQEGEIVQERLETRFGILQANPFPRETSPDFSSHRSLGRLELSLSRGRLFAWVVDPQRRYRDFVLAGEVSLGEASGYAAAGFLFRYIDEESYYYFLISSRGYFRFDLLFNRNPIPIIAWTPLPLATERGGSGILPARIAVRIVANGEHFVFCVDDACVAEIDDDRLEAGRIGFGGQTYEEGPGALVCLHHLLVDGRPLAVATNHLRWTEELPPSDENRIALARTLFAMGQFSAAVVQLRKAFRRRRPTADELFLLAECQINLHMYEPALDNVERSLSLDPDRQEAIQEKANLLYLMDRFLELRDYLLPRIEGTESSTLWNLYGHAEFALGNWDRAAVGYGRAAGIEPEMPLYALNEAHALERQGRTAEALARYIAAARLFLRQEAYDDLDGALVKIGALDSQNSEGRELKGKLAFHYGEYAQATKIFEELIAEDYRESGTLYLLGLLRAQAGRREDAEPLLAEAAEREPGFALFWFRLAENRYLSGREVEPALTKALELAPDDPWTLNLAGEVALDGGRPIEAVGYFERARARAPGEIEVGLNLAEAQFQAGEVKEAFATLGLLGDAATVHNLRGNFHARLNHPGAAVSAYEKALARDQENPDIMENLAAACIECDLLSRAEELLGRVMEIAPSISVMNRIGNLARIKGEYPRAEVAYREALERDPANLEMHLNLAELYLDRLKYGEAKRIVQEVLAQRELPRALRLLDRIRRLTEVRFVCASCNREWWAPRVVEPYGVLRLQGEPPGDSPAGQCPSCGRVYCVACAQAWLRDSRFYCPTCGENLKLTDDRIKYLVLHAIENASVGDLSTDPPPASDGPAGP